MGPGVFWLGRCWNGLVPYSETKLTAPTFEDYE